MSGTAARIPTVGGAPVSPAELGRLIGVDVFERLSASTILANDSWHGRLVIFDAACTVTIPAGLRTDFSCGWHQNSSGAITFVAGAAAVVHSLSGNLVSAGQYATGSLIALAADDLRLLGQLTS